VGSSAIVSWFQESMTMISSDDFSRCFLSDFLVAGARCLSERGATGRFDDNAT